MLIKLIIAYLVIGALVALSPYYYLRKLNDKIESGRYVSLKAYDLLLFNTVMETSGIGVRVFVFLVILLFYPVIMIKHFVKYRRGGA